MVRALVCRDEQTYDDDDTEDGLVGGIKFLHNNNKKFRSPTLRDSIKS